MNDSSNVLAQAHRPRMRSPSNGSRLCRGTQTGIIIDSDACGETHVIRLIRTSDNSVTEVSVVLDCNGGTSGTITIPNFQLPGDEGEYTFEIVIRSTGGTTSGSGITLIAC